MTTLQIQTRRYDLLSFNTLDILHLNKNVTFFFFIINSMRVYYTLILINMLGYICKDADMM